MKLHCFIIFGVLLLSSVASSQDTCNEALKKLQEGDSALGQYLPQCDTEGNYEPLQCHFSTGYCWCVEIKSGKEIEGTRTGFGEENPDCSALQPTPEPEFDFNFDENDVCYQQNKKTYDYWSARMKSYHDQMQRWKKTMEEYEESTKDSEE